MSQHNGSQQTYASKSKRYIIQRDEWIRSLQVHITPQVERMLREFYKGAVLAHEKRTDLAVDRNFASLVDMSHMWSDDRMRENIGDSKARDADICLQQAVKCHATVLSLSTATPCRQQLEVPTLVKFFRSVLDAVVADLSEVRMTKEGGVSVFGTNDMAQRKRTRAWIERIVLNKCLEIVPVGMFARQPAPSPVVSDAEDSDEEIPEPEEKKKHVEAVVAAEPEPELIKIESATAVEGAKVLEKLVEPAAPAPAVTVAASVLAPEVKKEDDVVVPKRAPTPVAAAEAEKEDKAERLSEQDDDEEDEDDEDEDDAEEDEDEEEDVEEPVVVEKTKPKKK